MPHDPSRVVLGQAGSSIMESSALIENPLNFPSGTAVRLRSTGGLSTQKAQGSLIGVSLGRSLSSTSKMAVARSGLDIPLLITDLSVKSELVEGDLTFKAQAAGVAGDSITVELLDGGTAGAEEVTVTDLAISVSMEDGVSTAAQIKAAIDASAEAIALIEVIIADGESATAQDAFAEAPLAGGRDLGDFVVEGQPVYIDDATGLANASDESAVTITNAVYAKSGALIGVKNDRTEVPCCLINMIGGL